MLDHEFIVLLDAYRRLLRRNAAANLKKMIKKTHSADLAAVFRSFSDYEREKIYNIINDNEYKAELLTELDEPLIVEIINLLKETKRLNKTIVNDLMVKFHH